MQNRGDMFGALRQILGMAGAYICMVMMVMSVVVSVVTNLAWVQAML